MSDFIDKYYVYSLYLCLYAAPIEHRKWVVCCRHDQRGI